MKASNLVGSVLQRFNAPPPGDHRTGRSARTSHEPRPPSELSLRASSADMLPHARSLPQALHSEVLKAADQVGWLCSLQKDVEDQTTRVWDRLIRAEKELADKQRAAGLRQQPEIRPAELRLIQEQVAMLSWRHDALGERQQAVAQMLQEARNDLAQAQAAMAAPSTTQAC